ncbi:MAG: hypothetical protein GXY03_03445, partial [Solirubrobacterales bacterium]|nr:hypothetical protein [Solirubrobacterales bacterium]
GVIDWADAAVTDPAKDLGLILRDLGEEALAVAHARCVAALPAADPGLLARAVFYARCLALEDLAHGLAGGDERYSRNASAALDDLLGT